MSGAKRCVACRQISDPRAPRCWVCGGPLVDDGPAVQPAGSDDTPLRLLGWIALLGGIGFVTLLVAVELAMGWTGLLIPYALVMLLVFGALGRTAWVHIKGARAPTEGAPGSTTTGEEILKGVALAMALTLAVLALLLLMAVAAIVLFLMVCFAIIGAAGGLH